MKNQLTRFSFRFTWPWGLVFILLLGIPRFLVVLQASKTGNYQFTSLLFVVMLLLPFIFLTSLGRGLIGIVKPLKPKWLLYSLMTGALFSLVVYQSGEWLFGNTSSNWFVYLSNAYQNPQLSHFSKHIQFIIYGLIGITFSPIGEELFYRGLVHQCFVKSFGENKASMIDSAAFAFTHLAHFGILYLGSGYFFKPFPAVLWLVFMFMASRLFFLFKLQTGSIWGAVLGHAGFNLGMTYLIVYHIL